MKLLHSCAYLRQFEHSVGDTIWNFKSSASFPGFFASFGVQEVFDGFSAESVAEFKTEIVVASPTTYYFLAS